MSCGWSLVTTHPFWQPTVDVLVLSISTVLSFPASYHHLDYPTQSTNERKDTSMTATMLLQDSMLKPSVFRSSSETQEKVVHLFWTYIKMCKYCRTESQQTTKHYTKRYVRDKLQIWHTQTCLTLWNDSVQDVHQLRWAHFHVLRDKYLTVLTSQSQQKDVQTYTVLQHGCRRNILRGVKVVIALTSPASCWKTLRNCFSSSLSCCSAYTAGLRGGGCRTE